MRVLSRSSRMLIRFGVLWRPEIVVTSYIFFYKVDKILTRYEVTALPTSSRSCASMDFSERLVKDEK